MEDPIRILHVFGKLNRGGAETMIMNLYRNIDRSKVQFDFVVHTDDECAYDSEIESLGGIIYHVPKYTGINHSQYKKAWRDFLKEHSGYKIIHSHVRSTASIYLRMAKKQGLHTIAHSHNTSSGKKVTSMVKNIMQYQIRFIADDLFACSKGAGDWLFGKKRNYIILKNAIDTKEFRFNEKIRQTKREELKVHDKFVIGHVGRFDAQKNHEFLIEIFNAIHINCEEAVLVLIGDGVLRKNIEEKVNKLRLKEFVIFTGVRSDVAELLQAADIFLFPSLFEGLPVTLIEAQASGLPCIISDRITDEIELKKGSVSFCSLNDDAEIWADEVLKKKSNDVRQELTSEIIKLGYDIHSTAKWLQKFYLKANEEKENIVI